MKPAEQAIRDREIHAQRGTGKTYVALGKQFGLAPYTVLHACRRVERDTARRLATVQPTPETQADVGIDMLYLPIRAHNVLVNLGLRTAADIANTPDDTLLREPNCGRLTLSQIRALVPRA